MDESAPDTGPIDYLVVEFPEGTRIGEGLPRCLTSWTAD